MNPPHAALLRRQTDTEDVWNSYNVFLGRGIESSQAVEDKLGSSLANTIISIILSDEFKDFVLTPVLLGEAVKQERFLQPPTKANCDWVARRAPLTPASQAAIAGAKTWLELHRQLFTDDLFQAAISRLARDFAPQAFATALAERTYGLAEDPGHTSEAALLVTDRSRAQHWDKRAHALLSQLSEPRLSVLFDRDHIFSASGVRFRSSAQALSAYFKTSRQERFSLSAYFDQAYYRRQFKDELNEATDPFSHFISNLHKPAVRPSLMVEVQRLARDATGSSQYLDAFCDFLSGREVDSFHALIDIAYIRTQPGYEQITPLDILAAVADEGQALRFRPHPLFDPGFYRRQVAPSAQTS